MLTTFYITTLPQVGAQYGKKTSVTREQREVKLMAIEQLRACVSQVAELWT